MNNFVVRAKVTRIINGSIHMVNSFYRFNTESPYKMCHKVLSLEYNKDIPDTIDSITLNIVNDNLLTV